ncbi:fructose-1,6-bisphosphatase [Sphingomonas palmae]|uniref:Fructose-1,6-bisphosphatase n=1 Tax=Sphingomonas palmae TaxID=1855283 RepID=A0A1H7I5T8_9SPHN|nr:inositol monophosphatase family protein [Sphingomonas palmae]SEK57724.1 fructose-1,6-bisphosphatase [Sphingomonas palmae]
MSTLDQAVAALLERVAGEVILPRFGRLNAGQSEEKTPGDWVTIADRESEAILTDALLRLDPDARVVGEEAASIDPSLIETVAQGRVWLVDPLDGTNNFAEGREPFGMMVALVEDGVVQRGWIYAPVTKRLCFAARGEGAFIDGTGVTCSERPVRQPIATYSNYWFSDADGAAIERKAAGVLDLRHGLRCAAAQYAALVDGSHDIARFERIYPWDHAAGSLFLTEAGGHVARPDGHPYALTDTGKGLLAAASPSLWKRGARVLGAITD